MLKVIIAVFVLLILIGIGLLGKRLLRAYIFRSAKVQSSESFWIEFCAGIIVIVVAIAEFGNNRPYPNLLNWAGVLIFFAGGLLQFIARRQLYDDRTFEERLSSGFEAAQTKLYAHLRYPGASALILLVLGFCLALDSYWALGLAIFLFIPGVFIYVSQQERKLYDKFGGRWLDYKKSSKRVIPGVF